VWHQEHLLLALFPFFHFPPPFLPSRVPLLSQRTQLHLSELHRLCRGGLLAFCLVNLDSQLSQNFNTLAEGGSLSFPEAEVMIAHCWFLFACWFQHFSLQTQLRHGHLAVKHLHLLV
jgi:hypothetical protein